MKAGQKPRAKTVTAKDLRSEAAPELIEKLRQLGPLGAPPEIKKLLEAEREAPAKAKEIEKARAGLDRMMAQRDQPVAVVVTSDAKERPQRPPVPRPRRESFHPRRNPVLSPPPVKTSRTPAPVPQLQAPIAAQKWLWKAFRESSHPRRNPVLSPRPVKTSRMPALPQAQTPASQAPIAAQKWLWKAFEDYPKPANILTAAYASRTIRPQMERAFKDDKVDKVFEVKTITNRYPKWQREQAEKAKSSKK